MNEHIEEQDPYAAYPDISGRPAQVIGKTFRLDAVIGRGSMGTVWRATDLRDGRTVAVKMVSRLYVASAEARRRFRREVRAVSRIRSRFALGIYASGETRDRVPYMVMDHLEGETLETRLERDGRLPLELAVRVTVQVCRALARAHGAGFVHRDLKPGNVFLATPPGGLVAKVLDFGVAKFLQEHAADESGSGESSVPTQTGVLLGTPEYMSPEQARGLRNIDARSDLYAAGMLFFTMVVGEAAVTGTSYAEVLLLIARGELPRLRDRRPDLPEALDAWFARACAFDPDDRHPSPEELAATLHEAAGLAGNVEDHLRYEPPPPPPSARVRSRESIVDFMATRDDGRYRSICREDSAAESFGGVGRPSELPPLMPPPSRPHDDVSLMPPTERSVPSDAPAPRPSVEVVDPGARRQRSLRVVGAVVAALLVAVGVLVWLVLR